MRKNKLLAIFIIFAMISLACATLFPPEPTRTSRPTRTPRPTTPPTETSISLEDILSTISVSTTPQPTILSTPNVTLTPTPTNSVSQDTIPRYEIPIEEDDPVLGSEDAPITIIEFSDYECPYCQRYHLETYPLIMETYGDQIRYVFKDLPLSSIHSNALPAANAAHCAQEQNAFWEYHDLLFSMQMGLNDNAYLAYADALGLDQAAFEECLNESRYVDRVFQDIQALTSIGAPLSTPTFFINGMYMAGAQPFSVFSTLIETELEKSQ